MINYPLWRLIMLKDDKRKMSKEMANKEPRDTKTEFETFEIEMAQMENKEWDLTKLKTEYLQQCHWDFDFSDYLDFVISARDKWLCDKIEGGMSLSVQQDIDYFKIKVVDWKSLKTNLGIKEA